jgi:hypothetical protein
MSTCTKSTEISQIDNLLLHFKLLQKNKLRLKTSRRREIIKIGAQQNRDQKQQYKESTKQKVCSLKK